MESLAAQIHVPGGLVARISVPNGLVASFRRPKAIVAPSGPPAVGIAPFPLPDSSPFRTLSGTANPVADDRPTTMGVDRDPEGVRHRLANRVPELLADDAPRVSAHLGGEYADADGPDARAMRRRGGSFEWVAFGFDPHAMWDAHVGVLVDDEVVVGIHIHERVAGEPPAAFAALGEEIGGEYRYSEAAAEHQYNRPPTAVESVDPDALARDVAALCLRFEPVVDELLG